MQTYILNKASTSLVVNWISIQGTGTFMYFNGISIFNMEHLYCRYRFKVDMFSGKLEGWPLFLRAESVGFSVHSNLKASHILKPLTCNK